MLCNDNCISDGFDITLWDSIEHATDILELEYMPPVYVPPGPNPPLQMSGVTIYSGGLGLFSLYLSWRLNEIELFIKF